MRPTYFQKLNAATNTRLWINNPTDAEVTLSLEQGAVSCTTNPTFGANQIRRAPDVALPVIDACLEDNGDDAAVADIVQQRLAARVMKRFEPIHEQSGGSDGWVSIQGNPHEDKDADVIVDEALRYRALRPNFIAKIPATKAGLKAIEYLIGENVPVIFTEVFAIAQMLSCGEVYERAAAKSGRRPACYITHITGIFDECLSAEVAQAGIHIAEPVLSQAGLAVARRQYRLFKERGLPGIMLGGGARGTHHFTGLVGGDMHITINWSTAEEIIKEDPPVDNTIAAETNNDVVEELLDKAPDFRKAWLEEGLALEEFEDYAPVRFFRDQFMRGWDSLTNTIAERRRTLQTTRQHG